MSGKCGGLHCPGCGDGGGWLGLVLIVVLIAIAAKVGQAVARGAAEAAHVLAVVLEVVFITIASAAGIGTLAALTWAGIHIHRRYANRAAAADRRLLDQPIRAVAEVVQSEPLAIEAPRPRLDAVCESEVTYVPRSLPAVKDGRQP